MELVKRIRNTELQRIYSVIFSLLLAWATNMWHILWMILHFLRSSFCTQDKKKPHQNNEKINKNTMLVPSLFMPIWRHFLSRHAWHWFRWALSMTQVPFPAWHLTGNRNNYKKCTIKSVHSFHVFDFCYRKKKIFSENAPNKISFTYLQMSCLQTGKKYLQKKHQNKSFSDRK